MSASKQLSQDSTQTKGQGDTHLLPKDASPPSWELTGTQDEGVVWASLGKTPGHQ